jgi:hypothetical protein
MNVVSVEKAEHARKKQTEAPTMKPIFRFASALALLAGISIGACGPLTAQQPAVPPGQAIAIDSVEPQTRGPIHEAFVQPIDVTPEPGMPVPKEPPPPIPELPPEEQPQGENMQWIPGYWAWDADRNDFLWVSGFFRDAPPGRQYVPGYWTSTPEGWRWVAGFWAPAQQDAITTVPEPPAPLETTPSLPAPDDDSTYVPGTWVYRDTRYLWRPGYWAPFRPGLVWVPARYLWTPSGYIFIDGYWDLPLESRGLLFSPVAFNGTPWIDPAWCYRPSFVVSVGALFDSCFYRPRWGHYYFGDYYGPSYTRLGYRPWYTGFGRHDPAFSYHVWQHRQDPNWFATYQQTYQARLQGTLAPPPRTFAQQSLLLRQAAGGGAVARTATNIQVVTPLRQYVQQTKNVTIVRAGSAQLSSQQAAIELSHQVVQARRQLDVVAAKSPTPRHSLRLPRAVTAPSSPVPTAGSVNGTTPSTNASVHPGGSLPQTPPAAPVQKHVPPVTAHPSPSAVYPSVNVPKHTPPATAAPSHTPPPAASVQKQVPPVMAQPTPSAVYPSVNTPQHTPPVTAAPSHTPPPAATTPKYTPAPITAAPKYTPPAAPATPKYVAPPNAAAPKHAVAPITSAPKYSPPATPKYTPPPAAPKYTPPPAAATPKYTPPRITTPPSVTAPASRPSAAAPKVSAPAPRPAPATPHPAARVAQPPRAATPAHAAAPAPRPSAPTKTDTSHHK